MVSDSKRTFTAFVSNTGVWKIFLFVSRIGSNQAFAERWSPSRPGLPNFVFPSWDSCFVSQKFGHQPQRPWTKTRTSTTTLGMGTTASKIQDGEGVDILSSSGSNYNLDKVSLKSNISCCWLVFTLSFFFMTKNFKFWISTYGLFKWVICVVCLLLKIRRLKKKLLKLRSY